MEAILNAEHKPAVDEVTEFVSALTTEQQEKFVLMIQAAKWTMELLREDSKEIS